MTAQPCDWVPLGAATLANGGTGTTWSGEAPASGRVSALVADPASPDTHLFVGTALGGVWETTDGGLNWSTLPNGDSQASLAIGALALSGNTLYIGTGEANQGGDSVAGLGLLVYDLTTRTFTQDFPPGLKGMVISSIVDGPGPTLFVGSDNGLWERGGGAWTQRPIPGVASPFVTDLVLSPAGYLWIGVNKVGLFVRHPASLAVARVPEAPVRLPQANIGRVSFGSCAQRPATLYAAFEVPATTGPPTTPERIRIFRTNNAPTAAPANAAAAIPSSTWTETPTAPAGVQQLSYNNVLAVHPRNPDLVFFGSDALHRTSDGGATWLICHEQSTGLNGIHVDQHALIVQDTTFTAGSFAGIKIWAGNDGGVWRTTDGGDTWVHRNRGLVTMQYFSVVGHPTVPTVVIGGTQDNGLQLFAGDGAWTELAGGDSGYVAIDPVDDTIWYGSYLSFYPESGPDRSFRGLERSDRRGERGSFIPPPGTSQIFVGDDSLAFAPYIVVPTGSSSAPVDIWLGTENLYRSDDRGDSFTMITASVRRPGPRNGHGISAIAIAPGHPERVYIGTSEGRFFVLNRPGTGWPKGAGTAILFPTEPKTTVAPIVPALTAAATAAGLPAPGFITAIAAVRLPSTPPEDRVYVTVGANHFSGGAVRPTGAGLFVSNDSGKTFAHVPMLQVSPPGVTGGVPLAENGANGVVIDPANTNLAWIACDYGVFQHDAATNTVTRWSRALPNAPVLWLDLFNHAPRLLRAATHGRGVWESLIDAPPAGGCVNGETFFRDIITDDARGATAATATNPLTGRAVAPNNSIDVAFDVPSRRSAANALSTEDFQPAGQIDYLGFATLAGGVGVHHKDAAEVHIRVHNRGPVPATNVAVGASWANADGTVPQLPSNFFASFPGSAPPTGGGWTSLGGIVSIPRIPPGESRVATFAFSLTDVPDKVRVLAATSSTEDPFGAVTSTDSLLAARASRHLAIRDVDVESSGSALLIVVLVVVGVAVAGTAIYVATRDD